jgi:hypothetical protein
LTEKLVAVAVVRFLADDVQHQCVFSWPLDHVRPNLLHPLEEVARSSHRSRAPRLWVATEVSDMDHQGNIPLVNPFVHIGKHASPYGKACKENKP